MEVSLKMDTDYESAYTKKDVIALRIMLETVNFNHKKSKEPIKTRWNATRDLINLKKHKAYVQGDYENSRLSTALFKK